MPQDAVYSSKTPKKVESQRLKLSKNFGLILLTKTLKLKFVFFRIFLFILSLIVTQVINCSKPIRLNRQLSYSRREIITVRGQSFASRLPKY